MSFAQLPGTYEARIPRWLRVGFLAVLTVHDTLVMFAGAWGLLYTPAALQEALGETWLDDVWGWLFLIGGALALGGAVSARPAVESIGCVLCFGAYTTLGVATIYAGLFGDYSVAGGIAIIAGGIGSLRRIGRVWAGAYLREEVPPRVPRRPPTGR